MAQTAFGLRHHIAKDGAQRPQISPPECQIP